MNIPIKFKDTLFSSANSFFSAIQQITINHIYNLQDDLEHKKLFIDIAFLSDEITFLRDNYIEQMKGDVRISDSEFQKYEKIYHISTVLYNWLEDIILTEKLQQIKNHAIRTKISTTNLLLVSVLKIINSKGIFGESSKYIYNLETNDINDQLYRYCYRTQEFEYRKEQKKVEELFLKKKSKLLQSESNLRRINDTRIKKYKSKKEGLIKTINSLKSQIFAHEQIENESHFDFAESDIDQFESTEECTSNSDLIDIDLQVQVDIVDITTLEKRLSNAEIELDKIKSLPDFDESKYRQKLEDAYKQNEKKLSELRIELLQECKKIENHILDNQTNEKAFFSQFTKDSHKLTSDWNKYLYIPAKKTTSMNDKEKIKKSDFCALNQNVDDKRKTDLIFRTLQYLEAYDLLRKEKIADENYVNYKINLEHSQDHPLKDKFVLAELFELLTAYLKFNDGNSVENFLVHIDGIVEYSMQEPSLFSSEYQHELIILEAYNEKLELRIEGKKKTFYKISDFSLSFNLSNEKIISFEYKNKKVDLKLSDIKSIEILEEKAPVKAKKISSLAQEFKSHISKYKLPDNGESRVILIANISHSEFFDVKPLRNQIVYKTKDEIQFFLDKNAIEGTFENKIFIEAVDTQDRIIYTVTRCIPNVKILEPTVIKEKFNNIIKSMCAELK